MKQIILFVLTFLNFTFVSAFCLKNGIYCLSKSSTLNKNGLIILEFYASSQLLITGLNSKYPIYLKCSKGKIMLTIVETLKGEFNLTQIILKPATILSASETYMLQIDNLPKYEAAPKWYNNLTKNREAYTFKVNTIIDIEPPIIKEIATEYKKTLVYYGCGPSSWVYFNLAGYDVSELFVRATVKNKSTGKITTYMLLLENGVVKIGRGMCAGAFGLGNSVKFEVIFQLYDQSGNKSSATAPILFSKPTIVTNEE